MTTQTLGTHTKNTEILNKSIPPGYGTLMNVMNPPSPALRLRRVLLHKITLNIFLQGQLSITNCSRPDRLKTLRARQKEIHREIEETQNLLNRHDPTYARRFPHSCVSFIHCTDELYHYLREGLTPHERELIRDFTFQQERLGNHHPLLLNYNPDEPRDQHGRWTSGDSSAENILGKKSLTYREILALKLSPQDAETILKQYNIKVTKPEDISSSQVRFLSATECLGKSEDEIRNYEAARINTAQAKLALLHNKLTPDEAKHIQDTFKVYGAMLDLTTIAAQIPFEGVRAPAELLEAGLSKAARTSLEPIGLAAKDFDDIIKDPALLGGRSPQEVTKLLDEAGIKYTVRETRGEVTSGTVIDIEGHSNINQLRFHPGGGRHEGSYWTISGNSGEDGITGKIQITGPNYKSLPGQRAITKGRYFDSDDD